MEGSTDMNTDTSSRSSRDAEGDYNGKRHEDTLANWREYKVDEETWISKKRVRR